MGSLAYSCRCHLVEDRVVTVCVETLFEEWLATVTVVAATTPSHRFSTWTTAWVQSVRQAVSCEIVEYIAVCWPSPLGRGLPCRSSAREEAGDVEVDVEVRIGTFGAETGCRRIPHVWIYSSLEWKAIRV